MQKLLSSRMTSDTQQLFRGMCSGRFVV